LSGKCLLCCDIFVFCVFWYGTLHYRVSDCVYNLKCCTKKYFCLLWWGSKYNSIIVQSTLEYFLKFCTFKMIFIYLLVLNLHLFQEISLNFSFPLTFPHVELCILFHTFTVSTVRNNFLLSQIIQDQLEISRNILIKLLEYAVLCIYYALSIIYEVG
jgi:hypothetical protein